MNARIIYIIREFIIYLIRDCIEIKPHRNISSISVDLDEPTAEALSMCTIQSESHSTMSPPVSIALLVWRTTLRFRTSLAIAAQFNTLGLIVDCDSLCMVHIERAPAEDSSSSTEMLDPILGTWSPGDEPRDPVQRKKLQYFQSTMFTECLPWYSPDSYCLQHSPESFKLNTIDPDR